MNSYHKLEEHELFTYMAERDSDFMLAGLSATEGALPVWALARKFNTSKWRVRCHLKELQKKGLVELKAYNYSDEYETYPPVRMFTLTDKARELDEVKVIADLVKSKILEAWGLE